MKNAKIIFSALCILLLSVFLCACSVNQSDKDKNSKLNASHSSQQSTGLSDASISSAGEIPSSENDTSAGSLPTIDGQTPNASTQAPAQENTKYGKDDVYTNDKGVPSAKTESGTEVELTSENMQKTLEEYQKIQGSGSERERELLDQIQVLLETMQYAQKN